jgi:hypothetical protein
MANANLQRIAPLSGLVFAVLVLTGFAAIGGATPETGDAATKVSAFYHDHYGRQIAAAVTVAVSAIFLFWFAVCLREALGSGRAGALAYAGLVVVAAGLLLQAAVHIALANAGHHGFVQAAQSLNVLETAIFVPSVGGLFVALTAAAAAALRGGVLPRWTGWLAALLAVASITPAGPLGAAAAFLWIAALGVILFQRGRAGSVEEPVVGLSPV